MRCSISAIALASTLALCFPQGAKADRGVWFWGSTTLPSGDASVHGSDDIVGDGALEDAAIVFLTHCSITRLYGSYGNRPFSEPEQIRPWNEKLDAAGIESQLVLELADEDDLSDPDHLDLIEKLNKRLILFNNAAVPAEQFKALHLDLEPQGLTAEWALGPAERRIDLDQLLDAYIDLRAELDSTGYSWVPIYADIPPTWDKMPLPDPADGKIGWTSTTDRDDWFAAIDAVLEGVSLMTFNKDSFSGLEAITAYERNPLNFAGESRVAIQPIIGSGGEFVSYSHFLDVLTEMETEWGKADLENYAFWRHFKVVATAVPFTADLEVAVDGPVIIFTGTPGHIYTVKHSSTLDGKWQAVAQLTLQGTSPREMRYPIRLDAKRGFWQVDESDETPPR